MESFKKDLSETSLCQRLPDGYFITSTEDLYKLVADYNSTLSNLLNHLRVVMFYLEAIYLPVLKSLVRIYEM